MPLSLFFTVALLGTAFGVALAFLPYFVISVLHPNAGETWIDQWQALTMLIVVPSACLWLGMGEVLLNRGRGMGIACGVAWPFLTMFIARYLNQSLHLDISLQPHFATWFVLVPFCLGAGFLMQRVVNGPRCPAASPFANDPPQATPWVACGLSILPGLGQLYNNEPWKALFCLVVELGGGMWVTKVLALHAPLDPPYNILIPGLFMLLVHTAVMTEAYLSARGRPRPAWISSKERDLAFLAITLIATFVANPFLIGISDHYYAMPARIFSDAMTPSILQGDRFLVYRQAYTSAVSPKRGDIILFEADDGFYYRRVIAIPGDHITFADGRVIVNSRTGYQSPHVSQLAMPDELDVPKDMLFVWIDNMDSPLSSHAVGTIHVTQVLGKVSVIFWSWIDNTFLPQWERFGIRPQ